MKRVPAHLALCVAASLVLTATAEVGAQTVHPLPGQANAALVANLNRLVTNPRDVDALVGAGEAALDLDDPNGAVGFFGRADDVSPNNGRVKAGLGRSMLAMGQTANALRLLDQAAQLGFSSAAMLSDRGMARDLIGDQVTAQRDYQAALRLSPDDATIIRRQAVSLGISGQLDMAEKALQPLLLKSDRGAWRDRAFILAMNGRQDQAVAITQKVMPPQLATAIQPYMLRMHMLNAAQKAEAVHQGKFPPGLVKMAVAPVAAPLPAVVAQPSAPQPARKNRRDRSAGKSTVQVASNTAPPEPAPPIWSTSPARSTVPAAQGQVATSAPVAQTSERARSVPPPIDYSGKNSYTASTPGAASTNAAAAPANASSSPAQAAGRAPIPLPQPPVAIVQPIAPAPAQTGVARSAYGPPSPATAIPSMITPAESAVSQPPSPPADTPVADRTLAAIMADLQVPEEERKATVAPVDLAEIARMKNESRKAAEQKARKDAELKAKKEAEAKALAEKKRLAANPARLWVQIGTGRDPAALVFTLRAMRKDYSDAIGQYKGWSAEWGRTNRLVIGPFTGSTKAKSVVAALKKGGSDAFIWNSEAGEVVTALGGK